VKLVHAAREVARHRTKATARRAARRHVQSSVNHPAGVIGPLLLARVTLSAAGRGACSLLLPFAIRFRAGSARFEQPLGMEPHTSAFRLIHSLGGDCQVTRFEAFDPALRLKIPEVELHVLVWNADEARKLHLAHAGIAHAEPPLRVEQ